MLSAVQIGSGPEEVWRRMKRWAFKVGNADDAMPTHERCPKEATRIAYQVLGGLSETTIDFYATEARWMVEEIREARGSDTSSGE